MMALHLAIIRLMFIELWQEARARIGHADTLCVCVAFIVLLERSTGRFASIFLPRKKNAITKIAIDPQESESTVIQCRHGALDRVCIGVCLCENAVSFSMLFNYILFLCVSF